ncbi:hypothetical protein J6590_018442 [Homalodisca vitripennis]|nr:hypothetical protein J6590_018442 [Homalodisca vitripennis]
MVAYTLTKTTQHKKPPTRRSCVVIIRSAKRSCRVELPSTEYFSRLGAGPDPLDPLAGYGLDCRGDVQEAVNRLQTSPLARVTDDLPYDCSSL